MWTAESFLVSRCLAVIDSRRIDKCVRLSQPMQLAFTAHYKIVVLTYLLGFRSVSVNLCGTFVN